MQTYGSLWQYCIDMPAVDNDNAIVNFAENNLADSFNFKVKSPVTEMLKQKMLK